MPTSKTKKSLKKASLLSQTTKNKNIVIPILIIAIVGLVGVRLYLKANAGWLVPSIKNFGFEQPISSIKDGTLAQNSGIWYGIVRQSTKATRDSNAPTPWGSYFLRLVSIDKNLKAEAVQKVLVRGFCNYVIDFGYHRDTDLLNRDGLPDIFVNSYADKYRLNLTGPTKIAQTTVGRSPEDGLAWDKYRVSFVAPRDAGAVWVHLRSPEAPTVLDSLFKGSALYDRVDLRLDKCY